MKETLVDIGINLTHDSFDVDREDLMSRAQANGVRFMIVTGSSLASTNDAVNLVKHFPQTLRATAGIHPHHAKDFSSDKHGELRELLVQKEVVATGECGLDYYRNFSPHADQERVFRIQLELACETQKPLFLHQRDAHEPFLAILKEYWPRVAGGVAHCFTGELDQARDYLDLGLFIGITGWICDERRGVHLREVVQHIPLDRMLIETDAPYLLPRDLKPKPVSRRNEPMFLPHILETIARCRNESAIQIAAATTANAAALFGWPNANTD